MLCTHPLDTVNEILWKSTINMYTYTGNIDMHTRAYSQNSRVQRRQSEEGGRETNIPPVKRSPSTQWPCYRSQKRKNCSVLWSCDAQVTRRHCRPCDGDPRQGKSYMYLLSNTVAALNSNHYRQVSQFFNWWKVLATCTEEASPFCFFSVGGPACSLPGHRVGCACCPGALPEFGGHRGRRIVCQNRVNMLGCAANYTYLHRVHDPQFTFHGNYKCEWASRSKASQYATSERITVQTTSCKLNRRLTRSIRVACSYDLAFDFVRFM